MYRIYLGLGKKFFINKLPRRKQRGIEQHLKQR